MNPEEVIARLRIQNEMERRKKKKKPGIMGTFQDIMGTTNKIREIGGDISNILNSISFYSPSGFTRG